MEKNKDKKHMTSHLPAVVKLIHEAFAPGVHHAREIAVQVEELHEGNGGNAEKMQVEGDDVRHISGGGRHRMRISTKPALSSGTNSLSQIGGHRRSLAAIGGQWRPFVGVSSQNT